LRPSRGKIVVAPIVSHVEINDDKRDNDGGNTEAEDIADVVSRDGLPYPRRRNHRLLRGPSISIFIFLGLACPGSWNYTQVG
jgi:hypothetical protein